MPRRVPKGSHILWSDALRYRPVLAALLGTVAAEWALLESGLAVMFAVLTRSDVILSTGILERATTVQQKRSLLRFATEHTIKDPQLRAQLLAEFNKVQDIAEARNSVVHARWGVCDDFPDELVWSRSTMGFDKHEAWSAADFNALIARIVQQRNAIQAMMIDVMPPPKPGTI